MGCRRLRKPLRYRSGRHPSILVKGGSLTRPMSLIGGRKGSSRWVWGGVSHGREAGVRIGWKNWDWLGVLDLEGKMSGGMGVKKTRPTTPEGGRQTKGLLVGRVARQQNGLAGRCADGNPKQNIRTMSQGARCGATPSPPPRQKVQYAREKNWTQGRLLWQKHRPLPPSPPPAAASDLVRPESIPLSGPAQDRRSVGRSNPVPPPAADPTPPAGR